ncbi:MAG: pyruvate formate-lyase activating enzyme [Deltaproteobacteria bacterium]|nr:pyruvate formate-lyase activating enzyme [Deltaproteobacteria bacterium]
MTFLMIDIGAGTMDLLWYESATGEHYKAVAPSPVRDVARRLAETTGSLVVTGVEMGGGPVSELLRARARSADVVMSAAAAATLHHDPERVRGWGIRVEDPPALGRCLADPTYTPVTLGDVQSRRITELLAGLGLPPEVDVVALCAQDHGVAPEGTSHLDFRQSQFRSRLDENPSPRALLFRGDEVPASFNRLRSIAQTAAELRPAEVYVLDSGMAAILGATQDVQLAGKRAAIVLDIATSHTVAAVVAEGDLAGYFEYHTRDVTLERLETLLPALADGRIDHATLLAEGGHGAYLRRAVGFDRIETILATGPKRRLVAGSSFPITWGAPWGDNMMTGTVGLLEAVRRRKGLAPIQYL